MAKELTNLHFVRAVLIILIVLYHSALFWTGSWYQFHTNQHSQFLSWGALWLNSFHIYCFVFVSGYLFYYLKKENKKYNDFMIFTKDKAYRLLIPYVFVSLCWNIPFAIYFKVPFNTLFRAYILGVSPEQLWFLLMLFGVFILFYFLEGKLGSRGNNKFSMFLSTSCFFLFFFGISGWFFVPNYFQVWNTCMFIFFFYMGYSAREGKIYKYLKTDNIHLTGYFIIHLFLFILINSLSISNPYLLKFFQLTIGYICHILGAFVIFHFLAKLSVVFDKWNKFFQLISINSLGIYLFHQQLVHLCLYFTVNRFNPYIITSICFIFSFSISLLITMILSNTSCTRWLIGVKSK